MIDFSKQVQEQFNKMAAFGKLFRVEMTGREVWDLYLSSFPKKFDPVFRDPNSSTHNCNHCKNFIRRYGNIVAINENHLIITMFDVEADEEYKASADAVSKALRESTVKEVFFETFNELNSLPYEKCTKNAETFQLGVASNVKQYTKAEAEMYGVVKPDEIRTFNHLHLNIPSAFVDTSGASIESIMANHRDAKNVFQRAMVEIPMDTLKLVRDLINQGSLLDGETHLHKIEKIIPLKEEYDNIPICKQDNWCWVTSRDFQFSKFKNELIGVLCSELAEGEDLNKACQSWNKRVDPANYMKATAPITQKQIDEAQKFVEENGYSESFDRRIATVDDIKASDIKHINSGDGKVNSISMFDSVKPNKSSHKRNKFEGVDEVTIDKFMSDILPECSAVEVFLQNKHEGNMVVMTTANEEESKLIFKWDNNYSWTFNGNLAGKSEIKDSVTSRGGRVDGDLRFSIMWSEGNDDNSDLDAHCVEPLGGTRIYFSRSYSDSTGGRLDVDIRTPMTWGGKDVVENITYPNKGKMIDGTYTFLVHQYRADKSQGFRAEIEFNGEIYSYTYDKPVSGEVKVAEVTLKDGEFTIKHLLPETNSSREVYGLPTNEFHKVNLVCLSPNHWGDNNTGNKYYFFMLDGCKVETSIRGFHIENLTPDLQKHRKVMEVLGNTNMIEPNGKQLAGVGFNSSAKVKDELIVKLSGNFKRVIKVKF